jgi:hypothetical protein
MIAGTPRNLNRKEHTHMPVLLMEPDEREQYNMLVRYVTEYPTFTGAGVQLDILAGMLPLVANMQIILSRNLRQEHDGVRGVLTMVQAERDAAVSSA